MENAPELTVLKKDIVKVSEEGSTNFENHRGYKRVFAPQRLTLGLFLPLSVYTGKLNVMEEHIKHIRYIDQRNFAAIWVRDIPLYDPGFGDAGQVFDALGYLSYLAGQTHQIALGTGSIVLPLWHPVALAKMIGTLDHLSNNRLLLGIGSGDRMAEFPAFGVDFASRGARFANIVEELRMLTSTSFPTIQSEITQMHGLDLIPKPVNPHIPMLITGSSQQSLSWIAAHGDGWITYPGATASSLHTARLRDKIQAWRALIPHTIFKPHMTNEWIDLVDDPHFPRTPIQGGFVLKTGRLGLIELLQEWQEAGVNHAALGIQYCQRPIPEVIDELASEVLPHFPTLPTTM